MVSQIIFAGSLSALIFSASAAAGVIYRSAYAAEDTITYLPQNITTTFNITVLTPRGFPVDLLSSEDSGSSYAPQNEACPPGSIYIRRGPSISSQENAYVSSRRSSLTSPRSQALLAFLQSADLGIPIASLESYVTSTTSSLAFSGGGYRAMLNGAGIFSALDARAGGNGLLQGSDYITGLSGGNWLVGSMAVNDFATIDRLRSDVWNLDRNLISPGGLAETAGYLAEIKGQVQGKADAGFDTSITDYWGLALGRQLVDRDAGGVGTTWSGIRGVGAFRDGAMPFPIVVADARNPGEASVEENNATIYEFSPYEFGTWGQGEELFFPTAYLGTAMDDGSALGGNCTTGFDYAGFVMGTSSSLFTMVVAQAGNLLGGAEGAYINNILASLGLVAGEGNDVAKYPNPFYNYNSSPNSISEHRSLHLVDGGEDKQNIPLWPLLQPSRQVDFILAVDSSADTDSNYPDGTSMVSTYRRIQDNLLQSSIPFPSIPDTATFIDQGLNSRPTFFGCNAETYSTPPPLIAYIPNAPWSYSTNASTFKLDFSAAEIDGYIRNGYDQISQGGDDNFAGCLACAVIQRVRERAGDGEAAGRCRDCFERYCWDETTAGVWSM